MKSTVITWALLLFAAVPLAAQDQAIWVRLDVTEVSGIPLAFSRMFDAEKHTLLFSPEDTLASLADLTLAEDTLMGPDCFVPEYKLVYRDYTYVISLYCGKIIAYANSAPFIPSNRRLADPLPFTESLYVYFRQLARAYFANRKASPFLLAQVQAGDPISELNSELPVLPDEDFLPGDLDMEFPLGRPVLPDEKDPQPKDEDPDRP